MQLVAYGAQDVYLTGNPQITFWKVYTERLPVDDARSQALVAAMREEELAHGAQAVALGARPLPAPVRCLMKVSAKAMTESTYWV